MIHYLVVLPTHHDHAIVSPQVPGRNTFDVVNHEVTNNDEDFGAFIGLECFGHLSTSVAGMAMENPNDSILTNIMAEESPCTSPTEPSKPNNNSNSNNSNYNDLPNKTNDSIVDPADVVKAEEKLIDSDPRDKYYVKEEKESNQN
ncbi:hypothetical protein FRACYDRAFT_244953 [Fragilariopsis cylindrus CCMP1102]|uniref:Uncharacterized protein n=1 Tax=Fragilariopsis cylindrus CCMP1102 TaxID=635003 RepID=A0A1E7F153_9STRA|nr:hypothetical protein FRACYDRAFT_244953 [Fragilariopsis cylindrus CCMP1102]|eukprot:OEU11834.1 hypothetical protein FRACYDRAFT_244953 [Fragilariopsis cylindrus CCMP1102]